MYCWGDGVNISSVTYEAGRLNKGPAGGQDTVQVEHVVWRLI